MLFAVGFLDICYNSFFVKIGFGSRLSILSKEIAFFTTFRKQ